MQEKKVFAVSIRYEKDFFAQYKYLSHDKKHHGLLESGRGGKYHIVGLEATTIIKGKEHTLSIETKRQQQRLTGNIIDLFQTYMQERKVILHPDFPPFQGGAIGYFSYDCMRYIERIPEIASDDLEIPELYFMLFDEVFIYEKEKKLLWIIVLHNNEQQAAERIAYWQAQWQQEVEEIKMNFQPVMTNQEKYVSFTEAEFVSAVEKIKEYIASGDVFQVNLSVRQGQPLQTHPLDIYAALREINPSPYMSYLQLGEYQVVSGSPELLVKKDGSIVSTRPIAGTRSRGKDEQEDECLANELITNEKERAEHVMLVDLERNDLGRVCQYGTVEVDELMVIEKYSHVMHIVSNVKGQLAEGKDGFDVVKATFPGGTITGAPKVRTMEIIEELEPVRRGIYTGSIGWIGYNGEMELNIVIRTMIAKDGIGYVQAGAGIVIDSNPKHEYKESLKKAAALWKAKEKSEQEVCE
ncbi:MAG: aminodeoxychorismate synthase, component I [Bacillaceae bacterium]